jgi:hypothetical protein
VLAFLLDIEIIKLTDGKKSLKDVFYELYQNSNETHYTEENLIGVFVSKVHPDLQLFFDKYIDGTEELNLSEQLSYIGVEYVTNDTIYGPAIGLQAIPLFWYYYVNSINVEGIQQGDKLDIRVVGRNCLKPYITDDGTYVSDTTWTKLPVVREGKRIMVNTKPEYAYKTNLTTLRFVPDISEEQSMYFNKWIGK